MAKTLTHQFIKTGIDMIRNEPGLWSTRHAGEFLAAAQTHLAGLARKLEVHPADALSESWMLWRRMSTAGSDLSAKTITHASAEIGRELKAARALTSSDDSPYRELLSFQKQLAAAAQARAAKRGDTSCPTVNVTAYGGHDDFLAQQATDMMVPGDDRHAELLDAQWYPVESIPLVKVPDGKPGDKRRADRVHAAVGAADGEPTDEESAAKNPAAEKRAEEKARTLELVEALKLALADCLKILRSIIDEESSDILVDGIATRVSVSGHGGASHVTQSANAAAPGTEAEDARRSAVASAAETIAKDRPLKGGPNDTLAFMANVSPEVVRLTARLLLGSKTPARILTSQRAACANGGVPVRKEAVVLSGVPQLIADGLDPWTQPHIINTVHQLRALAHI